MAPHPQRLTVTRRSWALARPFATAHGVRTAVDVVIAEIADGDARGRAEAVPLQRHGERIEDVVAAMERLKSAVVSGLNRETLRDALPAGAARNALDCAFWDIDAKRAYQSVTDLAGVGPAVPVMTAFTIALDTPEKMAEVAAANRARPLLRLKLGGAGDVERVQAVRQAVPAARLIVDASESWDEAMLRAFVPELHDCRVELIEQPFPMDADEGLAGMGLSVPLCADESCRTVADLARLEGKYQMVSIGLDKAGGLTEALALTAEATRRGFRIMAGGAMGTSLGVAPALLIARQADIVVLDGPLHLAHDRVPGLRYDGGTIHPPTEGFWGEPA